MIAIPKVSKTLKEAGPLIGRPLGRVDGPEKVTGSAKYAAEFNVPNLCYGYVVLSSVAHGRITKIDIEPALAQPGVLTVFTHENRPRTAWFDRSWRDGVSPDGSPFRPLYDGKIHFSMQPVAMVVAESFEAARAAARLVRIEYRDEPHEFSVRQQQESARAPKGGAPGYQPPPKPRGDADAAFDAAPVKIEAEYFIETETHNPMELFATTVVYEDDDTLTIYDKTQGCQNTQQYVSHVFGLSPSQVRIKNPFVGGGFGSGLRPHYQLFMATMAAMELKRSVRLVLTRPEMFSIGHRPATIQRMKLAAATDGKLQAIVHEAIGETSMFEDYAETVVNWSAQTYQCDNVRTDYKLVPLNEYTPLPMRAPGAATAFFAIESAMDELAAALKMDPIELRIKNYAETNEVQNKPYSSKELRACYQQAAERFGWSKRSPRPRSMKDGKHLIGYGMAGGVWDAMQNPADARAVLSVDGKLTVSSATADIGTGTYTVMTQIAAETLGLAMEDVTFKLGDSSLPTSPIEGGSWTVSSVGSAVKGVCDAVARRVFKLAAGVNDSPLAKAAFEDVRFSGGFVELKADPSRRVSITHAMQASRTHSIDEKFKSVPNMLKQKNYACNTHCCTFVEVRVDEEMGTIGVSRAVSAVAAGRVINPKTAGSQVSGAVVWGIGMALQEETLHDEKLGRFMNHDLAEYHVPVNADSPAIDVIFVEEHDDVVNALGAKGIGEIGLVGVAAAIANAIYHATGKRVRDLPITLDKML